MKIPTLTRCNGWYSSRANYGDHQTASWTITTSDGPTYVCDGCIGESIEGFISFSELADELRSIAPMPGMGALR